MNVDTHRQTTVNNKALIGYLLKEHIEEKTILNKDKKRKNTNIKIQFSYV